MHTWRTALIYTEQERAALAWAEAVTLACCKNRVAGDEFDAARRWFSEDELVRLTLVIATTDAWNRLDISFQPS